MRIGARLVLAPYLALAAIACGSRPPSVKSIAPAAPAVTLSFEDLLAGPPAVSATLHPPAIVRDPVYGPLLRHASAMAAAFAGPRSVGTTALAALERTEEVVVASNDASTEAVVVLRGVPADLDAAGIVDEHGAPIWRQVVGDLGRSAVEYEPATPADAALFVLPRRTWIIAVGDAKARTREALLAPVSATSLPGEEAPLAVLSIPGPALVRLDARLREGALAPVGRALARASFELAPGAEGVIDARLVYADPAAALASERIARDIVAAFRRSLEGPHPPPLAWLAAAGIERSASTVTVRAPIPKPWLAALAQADVSASPVAGSAAPAPSTSGGSPRPQDVPWQLWHHASPAPSALPER